MKKFNWVKNKAVDEEWHKIRKKSYSFILKNEQNLSGKLMLNLGCGKNIPYNNYLKYGANVINFDIDFNVLKESKNNGIENIVCGDINNLPFKNQKFDVVFCLSVIHHIKGIENPLIEMVNILKVGGKVYIAEPNYWNLYYLPFKIIPDKIRRWFKEKFKGGIEKEFILKPNEVEDILRKKGIKNIKIKASAYGFPSLPRRIYFIWEKLGDAFPNILDKFCWEFMIYGEKEYTKIQV